LCKYGFCEIDKKYLVLEMIKKTKTKAKNAAKQKSCWQSGMVDLMQAVNISRLSSFFMTGHQLGNSSAKKIFM
jgi:hypothetical protein